MSPILLYAVVLPLIVTGCLLLMAWRPWRSASANAEPSESPREDRAQWASAVGFAAAYLICHLGTHGRPVSGQLEAWEWLLMLVPLAAVAGNVDSLFDRPAWGKLASAALAFTTGWFIVPSFEESPWLWRVAVGVTVFALCRSQRFHAERFPGVVLPLAWIAIGSCGLPVLLASANAKFGLFSTSVAAASVAAALVWLWRRNMAIARGAVPVVSVLFPSLFFSGHFNDWGEVPLFAFVLLIAAPFALWMGALMSALIPRARAGPTIGLVAIVALCGVAVFLVRPILLVEPAY